MSFEELEAQEKPFDPEDYPLFHDLTDTQKAAEQWMPLPAGAVVTFKGGKVLPVVAMHVEAKTTGRVLWAMTAFGTEVRIGSGPECAEAIRTNGGQS